MSTFPVPPMLLVADAARLAGLCRKTIYRAIARGDLVASKFGSVYRIRWADFDGWLERSRYTPAAPTSPVLRRERPARSGPGSDEALRRIEAEAA